MKMILLALWLMLAALAGAFTPAMAHYGMVKPGESMVLSPSKAQLPLLVAFAHPFSQTGMNMAKPRQFYVIGENGKTDLLPGLEPVKYLHGDAWQGSYHIERPGVYQFVMEPEPYYEAAEDCFISHYVKTVVAAYGMEDGWETPIGLPMEILPLTRPFANYSGNSFTGRVLRYGKPLANATVEVEYLNSEKKYSAPNEYFDTQIVRSDSDGYFTFTMPWAGWWGFAALSQGDQIVKDGQAKDTELGGVLWLQVAPIPTPAKEK